MTRLQYSGRNHSSSLASKQHDWKMPGHSKKWVRAEDKAIPLQTTTITTARTQTVTRYAKATNWGTHSWKRPGTVEMGVAVQAAPCLKEPETSFKVENTKKNEKYAAVTSESSAAETANSIPYKVSRNTLVLQRNEATEPPKDDGTYVKHKKNSLRLLRRDTTKSQGVATAEEMDPTKKTAVPSSLNPDIAAVCKYSRTASQLTKKRKRPPPAKRINVDPVTDDLDEKANNTNGSSERDEEIDESMKKEGKNAKMLTDFAYRETKSSTRGKGLVRVQKDSAKICPTFLQGLECTNVRCMKRHDVPAELAMPICSFFQRKGMCLKEDCKFRHVKVSVGALNCPNFERKGYCDDVNCKLMHRNRKRAPLSKKQKRSIH